jgi:hypothetical protein
LNFSLAIDGELTKNNFKSLFISFLNDRNRNLVKKYPPTSLIRSLIIYLFFILNVLLAKNEDEDEDEERRAKLAL